MPSAELDRAAPQTGEEETLAALRASMQAGARLGDELATIMALIQGSEGGLAQLRQAARRLDRIAGEHETLAEALSALDRAVIEAAEAEDALAKAQQALTFDPDRLEEAEARLFDLRGLARKHRVEADALPALRDELHAKLHALEAGDAQFAALESALADARTAYDAAAAALTAARTAAAARLDAAVAQELAPLKLGEARFRTVLAPAEPGAVRPRPGRVRGLDQSRRAVRAAGEDRLGRRAVPLHPRAQGRARRGRRGDDDDLRRDRPRRRRRGRQRDRRAAAPARVAPARCWSSPTARRSPRAAPRIC